MTIIYLIIIAFLIVIIFLASQKIKWQDKRIDILERGIDALEKMEKLKTLTISEALGDIHPDVIHKGESSGATAKIVKAGSKGTLSIK